jgi:hypothetical protein
MLGRKEAVFVLVESVIHEKTKVTVVYYFEEDGEAATYHGFVRGVSLIKVKSHTMTKNILIPDNVTQLMTITVDVSMMLFLWLFRYIRLLSFYILCGHAK